MNTDLTKNSVHRAEIEGWSSQGYGVAHLGGSVVFVRGAAPGDILDVSILKAGKNTAWAKVAGVVKPSAHRVAPDCPVFPKCGGCDFRHITYEHELALKADRAEQAFRRIGHIALAPEKVIPCENIAGYRNKAIYPVAKPRGKTVTGFYRPRSHDVVPCGACPALGRRFGDAAAAVCRWMDKYNIDVFDEASGEGVIRRIFIRQNKKGELIVCLVAARYPFSHEKQLISGLYAACPELVGVCVNINADRTNTIFSGRYELLCGQDFIEDELCGFKFRLSPASFYQVNSEMAEKLYDAAAAYAEVSGAGLALDLYCGAGTTTLAIASRARRAVGVEISPASVRDARAAAAANGVPNVEFIQADAAEAAAQLASAGLRPDVVTLDPPRKGLDAAVIGAVEKMAPKRVVYISCDPATLARDLALFGAYRAVSCTVADMFPRTANVECAVLLKRSDAGG